MVVFHDAFFMTFVSIYVGLNSGFRQVLCMTLFFGLVGPVPTLDSIIVRAICFAVIIIIIITIIIITIIINEPPRWLDEARRLDEHDFRLDGRGDRGRGG